MQSSASISRLPSHSQYPIVWRAIQSILRRRNSLLLARPSWREPNAIVRTIIAVDKICCWKTPILSTHNAWLYYPAVYRHQRILKSTIRIEHVQNIILCANTYTCMYACMFNVCMIVCLYACMYECKTVWHAYMQARLYIMLAHVGLCFKERCCPSVGPFI